jgi:hypothetical protein
MAFYRFAIDTRLPVFNWNRIPSRQSNLYMALCNEMHSRYRSFWDYWSLVVALAGALSEHGLYRCCQLLLTMSTAMQDNSPTTQNSHIPLYLLFCRFIDEHGDQERCAKDGGGVIGTWWFRPGDMLSPFCSSAVARPLLRSLTKSFTDL